MASDPHWNKVVLGLKCDGTNGSTTFTDSSPSAKTVTANGNAQISTAQSKFGGASGYFDGAGDYLMVPNSTDFDFGSGDFTVEFWLFTPISWSSQASSSAICGKKQNDASNGWVIYRDGTQPTKLNFRFSQHNNLFSASVPTQNVWEHWAVTRSSGTLRVFKDGVLDASTTNTSAISDGSAEFKVGLADTWAGSHLNGYIDDLRITKGVARYTANFTPPATSFPTQLPVISGVVKDSSGNFAQRLVRAFDRKTGAFLNATLSDPTTGTYSLPVATADETMVIANDSATCDPYWGNVTLAMHMDGANGSTTFIDETGKAVTANGTAQISTTQSKFGGASAYFDGTGDYLTVSDSSDFELGGSDFTIECWIRPTAYPQRWAGLYYFGVVSKSVSADRGYELSVSGNGAFSVVDFAGWSSNSVYQSVSASLSGQIQLNTWAHLAVSRLGNTLRLFVNGTLVNSGAFTADIRDSATTLKIGAAEYDATYKGYFTGYIDDLRITKGLARYTANFTPPTAAFFGPLTGGTENAVILDRVVPV